MSALEGARAALKWFDDLYEPWINDGTAIERLESALRALIEPRATGDESEDLEDLYALWQEHGSCIESDSSEGRELAAAIIAAGFRRQGPITDAQVEAAAIAFTCEDAEEWRALASTFRSTIWNNMRDALEAARAVSS